MYSVIEPLNSFLREAICCRGSAEDSCEMPAFWLDPSGLWILMQCLRRIGDLLILVISI